MRICSTTLLAAAFFLIGSAGRADEKADKVAAQKKAAEENWGQLEAAEAAHLETAHLLIYAPKSMEKKLKDIGAMLEKHQEMARKCLGYDEKTEPWPGKLTIYLFTEREPFTAFLRRVEKRRVEADDTGTHSVDGDQPHAVAGPPRNKKDLALEDEIAQQAAAALLQKKAGKDVILPGWLLSGFGRATSYRVSPNDTTIRKERALAARLSAAHGAKDVWTGSLDGPEAAILEASVTDFLAYGPESSKFSKFLMWASNRGTGRTPRRQPRHSKRRASVPTTWTENGASGSLSRNEPLTLIDPRRHRRQLGFLFVTFVTHSSPVRRKLLLARMLTNVTNPFFLPRVLRKMKARIENMLGNDEIVIIISAVGAPLGACGRGRFPLSRRPNRPRSRAWKIHHGMGRREPKKGWSLRGSPPVCEPVFPSEAIRMARARKLSAKSLPPHLPCSRCQATGCHWDQIAGKPICPDCQEALAQGRGEPLVERTEKKPCVVCGRIGTLRFVTFPLDLRTAVEMDLCGEHFRSLVGRRLNARAFQNLRGQLQDLGLKAEQVFLLHEAFYDRHGRALQPAREVD